MIMNDQLASLKELARSALRVNETGTVEEFLLAVNAYLEAFEAWRTTANENKPQTADFRAAVEELDQLHREVVFKAHAQKDLIGQEMAELYKRAKVLKTYAEQGPSRISVTGKREG